MSHTLTQPEEVNLAILELESLNRRPDTSATNHSQQTSTFLPTVQLTSDRCKAIPARVFDLHQDDAS